MNEYGTALIERLQQSYQWVLKHASKEQQHQKAVNDLKTRGKSYSVYDLVFLHSPAVPKNKSKKFHRGVWMQGVCGCKGCGCKGCVDVRGVWMQGVCGCKGCVDARGVWM